MSNIPKISNGVLLNKNPVDGVRALFQFLNTGDIREIKPSQPL